MVASTHGRSIANDLDKATWSMFNRISRRYDVLNRILSFGRDFSWRRQVARFIPQQASIDLLDLATGTGDQLIALLKRLPNLRVVVGTDMSPKMLAIAKMKVGAAAGHVPVIFKRADAMLLPFESNSFDVITMSFGIRNVSHPDMVLLEMYRVLRPGGRAVILEFSIPRRWIVRTPYFVYFRYILPLIGGLLSGDRGAYGYLNRSVEAFPYGDEFLRHFSAAGFSRVELKSLTFGVATIYVGDKI